MAEYTEIESIEDLVRNFEVLDDELDSWAGTANASTWDGGVDMLSAAGHAFRVAITWAENVHDFGNTVNNAMKAFEKAAIDGADGFMDKAQYYGAHNEFNFDDPYGGYFYEVRWGESEVEYYMDEDGMTNEEANAKVDANLIEIALEAEKYVKAVQVAIDAVLKAAENA